MAVETEVDQRNPWLADGFITGLIVALLNSSVLGSLPVFSSLPVDLTALVGFTLGVTTLLTLCARMQWLTGFAPVAVLFATCIPAVLLSSFNEYGQTKIPSFFFITCLATAAAVTLVRTRPRILWLLWWFALAGLLEIIIAQAQAVGMGEERLALVGSNTVHLGRAAGAAICVIGVLILHLQRRRARGWMWGIMGCGVVVAFLAGSAFATGSRGPLIALAAAVILVAISVPGTPIRRAARLALATVALLIFALWGLSNAPELSEQRIKGIIDGNEDASALARARLYSATLALAVLRPLGVGWGDLSAELPPWAQLDSGLRQYPHNIFVEVGVEGGWIAAAALVAVVVLALTRARALLRQLEGIGVMSLLWFFLLNACLSGDVNDNRAFFVMLGVALGLPAVRRELHASSPPAGWVVARPSVVRRSYGFTTFGATSSLNGFLKPSEADDASFRREQLR
ncbi:O-antigen ligase family protein [Saccharopolyspora aridisoli]|nr:O-antigen ligase family protein [Saccharopolyspora aridisoli]